MTTLLELEQRILGSLLLNNGLMTEISNYRRRLQGVHFTEPTHQVLWDAIVDLMTSGKIANPITLKHVLIELFDKDHKYVVEFMVGLLNAGTSNRDEFCATLEQWWWPWYLDYLQTDEWKAKRRKVLDRCGSLCEGCREAEVTQVHHLSYHHAGDELLFELVGLCDVCHARVHRRA